jgi:hypothetical protein
MISRIQVPVAWRSWPEQLHAEQRDVAGDTDMAARAGSRGCVRRTASTSHSPSPEPRPVVPCLASGQVSTLHHQYTQASTTWAIATPRPSATFWIASTTGSSTSRSNAFATLSDDDRAVRWPQGRVARPFASGE